jgi:hypothetical protein
MFVNSGRCNWCATSMVFIGPPTTGVDERGSSTLFWGDFQTNRTHDGGFVDGMRYSDSATAACAHLPWSSQHRALESRASQTDGTYDIDMTSHLRM